jgi:hypothetical protein
MLEHLLLSSFEVKSEWSFTSAPPICLHEVERETHFYYTLSCLKFTHVVKYTAYEILNFIQKLCRSTLLRSDSCVCQLYCQECRVKLCILFGD